MDDTLATHLLSSLLPPELANYINVNILNPRSPFQVLSRQAIAQARTGVEALLPLLQPLLDRVLLFLEANQGAVDVLVPLFVLISMIFVMNWVRRIVMWWTRLAMRAVFWAAVFAFAAWVWNRGVFESARDVTVLVAKVVGYMTVVKNVWLDEYKQYNEAQATGRWDEFSQRSRSTGRYQY